MFTRANRGFSLLELLIVILIIAILIAVAIPNFFDFKLRSQRTKAKEDIDIIVNAISLFELEESKSLWDFVRQSNGVAGFVASEDTIVDLLIGPYLKNVNADPWGSKYCIDCEVGYVLARGANGVQNELDTLADVDVKVYYNDMDLTIKDCMYVDIANDGITLGDKVYIYFSQTIAVDGSLLDLASENPPANTVDMNFDADDDPAVATTAGFADCTIFTTAPGDGDPAGTLPMVATDIIALDDWTEDQATIGLRNDTRVIVLTLAATGAGGIAPQTESNLKNAGYITMNDPSQLIACDGENDGTGVIQDRTSVIPAGLGVRIRRE